MTAELNLRRFAWMMVALGASAIVACAPGVTVSSGPSAPPSSSPVSRPTSTGSPEAACSIFTLAEVETATGMRMDAGSEVPGPGGADGCQYFGAKGATTFALFVYHGPDGDAAEQLLSQISTAPVVSSPGLGDEARESISAEEDRIAARRGNAAISITITGAARPLTEPSLKSLAAKALAKA